jgi:hypothetical protein
MFLPDTKRIYEFCKQQIPELGGRVIDAYEDGRRLFLRSVRPEVEEVRPRDGMQGGVAVRVVDQEIQVHLYLFRQVCRNGAVMAHMLQSRVVERVEPAGFDDLVAEEAVLAELSEALQSGFTPEAFADAIDQVRSTLKRRADPAQDLMSMLVGMPSAIAVQVMQQFTTGRDQSLFGLMNAMTAVARDTPDPELRWRLEELGGGVPARLHPKLQPDDSAAVALRA